MIRWIKYPFWDELIVIEEYLGAQSNWGEVENKEK